jgi:hypothetical protein
MLMELTRIRKKCIVVKLIGVRMLLREILQRLSTVYQDWTDAMASAKGAIAVVRGMTGSR